MCLYPRLIKNKKYTKNQKNGGVIPPINDMRVTIVSIGCQQCIECRQRKSRDWQVRLREEIKGNRTGKFMTLTLSDQSMAELSKDCEGTGYELENAICTLAVRRFLERWRKRYKRSARHWLITELGHNGTERIHLHGIIWTTETWETIQEIWGYGFTWKGRENYVNGRTISYISKYITKQDEKHKGYTPKILTSPGIGRGYEDKADAKKNEYVEGKTNEAYRTESGHKIALPIYYRNKIYSEEEREKLWIEKLDKNERWVCGERVDGDRFEEYMRLVKYHRERSKKLGYGDNEKTWKEEEYELKRGILLKERLLKAKR